MVFDLIEKERLKNGIKAVYAERCAKYNDYEQTALFNMFMECLDACPTIDGELVRHGYIVWKESLVGDYRNVKTKCRNCGTIEEIEIEHPVITRIGYCSECKKRIGDVLMNYCPNCGAKISGGDENYE